MTDSTSFVTDVHCQSEGRGFVLHAIVKRKYLYFYAYGMPDKWLAKYKCSDVVDGKITIRDAVENIIEKYKYFSEVRDGKRQPKEYPKKHQH